MFQFTVAGEMFGYRMSNHASTNYPKYDLKKGILKIFEDARKRSMSQKL